MTTAKNENFWGEWIKSDDAKRLKLLSALPLVKSMPKDAKGELPVVLNSYFSDLHLYMKQLLMYNTVDEDELRARVKTELTADMENDMKKIVKISERAGARMVLKELKVANSKVKDAKMKSKIAELIMDIEAEVEQWTQPSVPTAE